MFTFQSAVCLPTCAGQPGSVYIARTNAPGGGVGQPVAINLSNNPTQILKQSSSGSGPINPNTIGAKITAPSTSARLVNLPQQQLPIHMDTEKLTSSPSRPSILRRREGERDNVMPGKIKIFLKCIYFKYFKNISNIYLKYFRYTTATPR